MRLTRTGLLLLAVIGCRRPVDSDPPSDTRSRDTAAALATGDTGACGAPWSCTDLDQCFGALHVRPVERGVFHVGEALTIIPDLTPPAWVVTAPGSGRYSPDLLQGAQTWLFAFPDWLVENPNLFGQAPMGDAGLDDGVWPPSVPRVGADAVASGDLTGDAVPDLVLIEDTSVGEQFGNVLLFPGPLMGPGAGSDRGYDDSDTIVLTLAGATHGAPCGDLDGDNQAELCLASGILRGPVQAGDTVDVPLPAGSELLRQNAAPSGPGFALWTSTTGELSWISGIDADGGLQVAAASVLNGAPFAWSVAPRTGGAVVSFAVEDANGFLVHAQEIGSPTPMLSVTVSVRPTALAFGDVDGDGVEDVLVSADSNILVLDGDSARSAQTCALGTIAVPVPDSGLGEEMLFAELHGGGAPELILGAPREHRASGVPGIHGAAYLLRLPLSPLP